MSSPHYSFDRDVYEKALQSNRELQQGLRERLRVIAQRKSENRRKAAKLVGRLHSLSVLHVPPETQQSPSCRWDRLFFRGPDGYIPEANEDTAERRKIEAVTLLRCNNPPWSPSELKLLRGIMKEVGEQHDDEGNQPIDFEIVGKQLLSQKRKAAATGKVKRQGQRLLLRSADECRLVHQQLSESAFGKKEQEDLTSLVLSMPKKKKKKSSLSMSSSRQMKTDWQAVAAAMPSNRSAWECFREFQGMIINKGKPKSQPWTLLHDELLFKYIAALGPQLVIDGNECGHLRSGLFREKSKSHTFNRINQTLLNPNLKHDGWNNEEERRLALCMKIYSDQTEKALYLAGTHFEARAGLSVSEKWNRSLNPEYSVRPFSKEEDQFLLKVMRQHKDYGWVEIARQFFPERHPHRLMNRWSEIATDEDIVLRCGESLVQHVAATAVAASTSRIPNQRTITADDLVVQVRKRKR